MMDKSTKALRSEPLSYGDAGSGDHQSSTPNIQPESLGQPQADTLFIDAAASHIYHGQQFQPSLAYDFAFWDLPADDIFLSDQSLQPPVVDENTLDMMLIGDNRDNALLHDPLFPPPMDGNTPFDMMPIDSDALFKGPALGISDSMEVMPVANNVLHNQSSQLPVADTTALEILPWAASAQLFSIDPSFSPPFVDAPSSLQDQVSSTKLFDSCLPATLTTFDNSDLLGFPTSQSSTVLSAVPVNLPPATNQPFNRLGSPRPAEQQEVGIYATNSVHGKRPCDQSQSPIRPAKRLSSIRPKPLPVQPTSAASMSTMTSKPPPTTQLPAQLANIPANMLGQFELKRSGENNSPNQRTRSRRVCLICQTLRESVSLYVLKVVLLS